MRTQDARVNEMRQKLGTLLNILEQEGGVVPGSLYTSRTQCGRKTCKCMKSDYRHANRCLSFKEDGRSRTRTIPDELAEDIQKWTEGYRRVKALRKAIAAISAELLKEVDCAITASAREGQRRMLVNLKNAKTREED